MISLGRSLRSRGQASEPLPVVFRSLDRAGITPRRGQVTMIAGMPGSGKTLLSMLWAAGLAQQGVPGLYVSADTDQRTMEVRLTASLTGRTQAEVERSLLDEHGQARCADALDAALSGLAWCFDPGPSTEDVAEEVEAFGELWGELPAFVVVDNLLNLSAADDEHTGWQAVLKDLHYLARKTGAAVFVLHHTQEQGPRGERYYPEYPQPRKALQGKVAQLPELILTVGRTDTKLGVCPVKNRCGPADPSGWDRRVWFGIDLPTMRITSEYETPPPRRDEGD